MELLRKLVVSVLRPVGGGRALLRPSTSLPAPPLRHGYSSKPRRSGDKGPGRNFARKAAKRAKKELGGETVLVNDALLDGLKKLELQKVVEQSGKEKLASMKQVLSGIKVKAPTAADKRKQLGMPAKQSLGRDRNVPQIKGAKSARVELMNPEGQRLGIFSLPDSSTKLMPAPPLTPAEEERANTLKTMMRLKPRNLFQEMIENTAFPRRFPIDNEDYDRKEPAGFEEHVLLECLLEGFPRKGPVRHFMELVVTGLSKNPGYTAAEKRQFVEEYREYFSQFSADELQAVTLTKEPL